MTRAPNFQNHATASSNIKFEYIQLRKTDKITTKMKFKVLKLIINLDLKKTFFLLKKTDYFILNVYQ